MFDCQAQIFQGRQFARAPLNLRAPFDGQSGEHCVESSCHYGSLIAFLRLASKAGTSD
jgi:hypothetical protein